jgi:NAD+ synthase (glutamine-hydrolysing)
MKDGFIKVAAGTIDVTVADVEKNTEAIKKRIADADKAGVNLLVLPELCVTGYTCGDLFYSEVLLDASKKALTDICAYTKNKYPVVVIGLPLRYEYKLYNCAAVLHNGEVLALVPKTHLPNYNEFYEKRQFASAYELKGKNTHIVIDGKKVPFGCGILFQHSEMEAFQFGVELCEDLWAPDPPCDVLCKAGATIIANPSASNEIIGKESYRKLLISSTSARLLCGYVYCNAGMGESTQDMVFSQHCIIAENGTILAENKPFEENELLLTELDCSRIVSERHKMTSYSPVSDEGILTIEFNQEIKETAITRTFSPHPFVPSDKSVLNERAEAILRIQSYGLKKRVEHTCAKSIVVGISGGLDSCLALLVMVRAMDLLKRPRKDIIAVTMPCFGTTARTKRNAEKLCEYLGVTLREVNITDAVNQHFKDIGHDSAVHDVTYENCQARERTQVLMDISNKEGGFVVGTGDLSELALGWATYNGDHMSMYGVNTSVPKTLVRYIVQYVAHNSEKNLADVLTDILNTPVSPELLPADENGEINQKTEDLVGPYELHDFFLYYLLRLGFSPSKIFRLAKYVFKDMYPTETILHWLKVFVRRFFTQQFKRSCMPDGPKVGTVSLSPRSDWRMPSDASFSLWLAELDNLK